MQLLIILGDLWCLFFSDFICFAENQKVLTSTCHIHLGK